MPETRLVVVDPGHFHATLVQQQMYPELSPVVRVYAPLGPDLIDYLSRIARYNRRPQAATDWRLDVHAGPDFLDRIRDEPPGGVAIFSGRNRGKIDRIIAALEAGLHVLADKPAIIEPADLPRLEAALTMANEQQLVLADMMTGRHNTLVRLLQALRCDPEVFGDPVPGTGDEPGVLLSGVHYLRKVVAGLPNPRPAWYFDVTEQGEGLADTGVHLVDRVHETLFPDQPLDWQRDIEILAASRWPTPVSLPQFRELTGEGKWPDDFAPSIRGDVLEYLCNGQVDYRVRGIHVRLEVRWDWQAEQGDDTHHALYGGVAAGATDDYPRRHLVLRLEHPQLAAVPFREAPGGRPKHVRHPRKSVAGEIGRRPELDLGGRQVDRDVRMQPAPQPVGEQPANVVHVHVGKHHVGHGCGMDAGGLQSPGQQPHGQREVRVFRPHPSIDEYGPAAATHHDHVQRPLEHVRWLAHVVQPGRQLGRIGIGGQRRGWQWNHPIADHQHVNLADPQRVARRNQLVRPRSTGV